MQSTSARAQAGNKTVVQVNRGLGETAREYALNAIVVSDKTGFITGKVNRIAGCLQSGRASN